MDDELLRLKNLGKTSVLWLHATGIHTIADLRRLGAIQAYRAVQVRGFNPSKALLYSLDAALSNRPWNELPQEYKDCLNVELKNASAGAIGVAELQEKNSVQNTVDLQMRITMIITSGRETGR